MWYRITVKQPKHDQQVLVWDGHNMFVSRARLYSAEKAWFEDPELDLTEDVRAENRKIHAELKGSFSDFGEHFYFNDPKVFWMELPKPPSK